MITCARLSSRCRLGALSVAAMLVAASASAQVVTIELSYSNPGARSMGFGGAFVALADDATAAFANPAGLVQLVRPEVSAEIRHWSYATPYVAGGRVSGTPTGMGIDTEPGLRLAESSPEITDLSFLSFVYPKDKWSFALYRHQLVKFESFAEVNGLFSDPPGIGGLQPGFAGTVRDQDMRTSTDIDTVGLAFSAAYQLTENLSIGVGLTHFDGTMRIVSDEYSTDNDSVEAYFASNSFFPERLLRQTTITIDDTDWGLSGGFLWTFAQNWSLGGFYRQGPRFSGVVGIGPGPADPTDPEIAVSTPFAFPDVWGLGVAYRSTDGRLIVSFEWDRVEYSALIDELNPILFGTDEAPLEPGTELDDGDEYHLGAEYAFVRSKPLVALRLGVWLDPDHQIRNEGSQEDFTRAFSLRGDDEMHYAIGLGVAFEKIQIDVAVDLSELRDTASLSAIYSF